MSSKDQVAQLIVLMVFKRMFYFKSRMTETEGKKGRDYFHVLIYDPSINR